MIEDDDRKVIEGKLEAMISMRANTHDSEDSALYEGWQQALIWVLKTF